MEASQIISPVNTNDKDMLTQVGPCTQLSLWPSTNVLILAQQVIENPIANPEVLRIRLNSNDIYQAVQAMRNVGTIGH